MIIFLCLSRETKIYELNFNKYNNIDNNNGNGNAYPVYQIFSQFFSACRPNLFDNECSP